MREHSYSSAFADLVRERRMEMGLTQREAAELCGLDQTAISDIELGRNLNPAAVTLKGLHLGMGLDPLRIIELVTHREVQPLR